MKKLALALLLACSVLAGCSQTLGDRVQQENLTTLSESWDYIRGKLEGTPDDPATPEDETVEPTIPDKDVLDSHTDLLREAKELEDAKRETWQDQAEANGWEKQ